MFFITNAESFKEATVACFVAAQAVRDVADMGKRHFKLLCRMNARRMGFADVGKKLFCI